MDSPPPYPEFDGSQLCAQTDPHLFDPAGTGGSPSVARALCLECPFLYECREYAVWNDVDGMWGGTTTADRRKERKRRGITAAGVRYGSGSAYRQALAETDDGARPASEVAVRVGCSEATVLRARRRRSEVA